MNNYEKCRLAAIGAKIDLSYHQWDGFCFAKHRVDGVPHCGLTHDGAFDPIHDWSCAMELASNLFMVMTFSMGGFARVVGPCGEFIAEYENHDSEKQAMITAIVDCAVASGVKAEEGASK